MSIKPSCVRLTNHLPGFGEILPTEWSVWNQVVHILVVFLGPHEGRHTKQKQSSVWLWNFNPIKWMYSYLRFFYV